MQLRPVINGGVSPARPRMESEVAERRTSATFLSAVMQQAACHPGMSICIRGLVAAEHLNGLHGVCQRWDEPSGRWIVQLESGEFKKLRSVNCGVEKAFVISGPESPQETSKDIGPEVIATKQHDSADTAARMVLRASCVAQISMAMAQLVHPDAHHQHFYEPLMDCILPFFGLKASMQVEAKKLDNLQFVGGISAIHAVEILHGDGIWQSVLQGSVPHCPHALALGLFFFSGTSAWLVRRPLPYVEDEEEEEEKEQHEDDCQEESDEDEESSDQDSETEIDGFLLQSPEFAGFGEDSSNERIPGSSSDPYPGASKGDELKT